ncbi:MAG: VOC family protein [Pseudomonadota bacterium]
MRVLTGAICGLLLTACGNAEPKHLNPESVIKGVSYVGTSVADLDRATEFYRAAELEPVEDRELADIQAFDTLAQRSGVVVQTRMLRSVNAQIRLMQFADSSTLSATEPVPVQGPGIAHMCYQVDHATGAYEDFLEQGAVAIGDPDLLQINPRNPVYYGYVEDLDGAVVEIEHVDVAKLDLPEPPKNKYRIRHVSLSTPDIDRIVAFYSALLDEPKPRRVGGKNGIGNEAMAGVSGLEGAKVRMAWFQVRNLELEIFQYASHPTQLPSQPRALDAVGYNMIVFDVDDLAAAQEKFITSGGTIETDPEQMDGGEIVFGRDPDGNLIGLQKAPADAVISAKNFSGNGME